jgi:hypothetical protein|tara:strand:- start:9222 stop:10001 length:780 start_codon:yes stop_codon:yes gene_type:complete
MALDLDAIKAKLQELQKSNTGGGGSQSNNFWKPPVGKTQIRIVPYAFDKANPFQELFFHYEVGKRTMVSPSSYGRPDPIQEFAEKLKKSGDKEDWKLGRKIEPKFRCYTPIIVRGQESEGVKFYAFGKKIYQELLGVIADPDYGDITDLMSGRDVTIECVAPDKDGGYPSYSVRVKPNQTPATEDKAIADKIVNGQPELSKLFTELSYDEMKTSLEEWLTPDGDAADNVQTSTRGKVETAKVAETTDDINEAFGALFNS